MTERRGRQHNMKQFAETFYSSPAWTQAREDYKKRVGGLCEICWSNGIVKAGEIVHHKTPLTPENISDINIALGMDNLQLVCRECHAKEHDRRQRRYRLDELGRVIF